jgi:hypothetical protein
MTRIRRPTTREAAAGTGRRDPRSRSGEVVPRRPVPGRGPRPRPRSGWGPEPADRRRGSAPRPGAQRCGILPNPRPPRGAASTGIGPPRSPSRPLQRPRSPIRAPAAPRPGARSPPRSPPERAGGIIREPNGRKSAAVRKAPMRPEPGGLRLRPPSARCLRLACVGRADRRRLLPTPIRDRRTPSRRAITVPATPRARGSAQRISDRRGGRLLSEGGGTGSMSSHAAQRRVAVE